MHRALLLRIALIGCLVGPTAIADAEELAAPGAQLAAAALARTTTSVRYDGSYRQISYPGGDVPADVGVCSDLVIRAYRALGVDLQLRVHEDMRTNFAAYPQHWGLSQADANIDHRRVPNLERFFERAHAKLPLSDRGAGYLPGDVVTWRLNGRLPHIGIVTTTAVEGTDRYMIAHNIGAGPAQEDVLFAYPLQGHYRYLPENSAP